jgi:hypothetical protein
MREVTLGGRKIRVMRPRIRAKKDKRELPLPTY